MTHPFPARSSSERGVPDHDQGEKDGVGAVGGWRKAGEAGLLLSTAPEEYGGAGADFGYCAIVIEESTRVNASGLGFQLHSDIVAPYIETYGSEELKKAWLPRMATGEIIGGICMTEPGTGRDLPGVKTRAVSDGRSAEHTSELQVTNAHLVC